VTGRVRRVPVRCCVIDSDIEFDFIADRLVVRKDMAPLESFALHDGLSVTSRLIPILCGCDPGSIRPGSPEKIAIAW